MAGFYLRSVSTNFSSKLAISGSPLLSLAFVDSLKAITKNGLQVLAGPPKPDLAKYLTDNKIRDEEVLKILERPLARSTGKKNKKKKKAAKKPQADGEEESSDDDE